MSCLGSTGVRVTAYVVGLAVVLAAALGVGRLVGPLDVEPAAHEGTAHQDTAHEDEAGETHGDTADDEGAHGGHDAAPTAELPGGLQLAQDGHALDLVDEAVQPGRSRTVRFRVLGPDGAPVTSYDVEHEKRLHLVAVRRDLSGYQHVHPTLSRAGTWTARLGLEPGTWRLFADFVPTGGPPLTLGTDLQVPGAFTPATPPEPSRLARTDDYEVRLDGDLVAGEATTLALHVARGGRPVTDLQPYLGAHGHLVAIREGDLAYLHVHPEEGPPGPTIEFGTTLPTPGRYRLFLDFRHDDVVRTATFAVAAGAGPAGAGPTDAGPGEVHPDQHGQEDDGHDH